MKHEIAQAEHCTLHICTVDCEAFSCVPATVSGALRFDERYASRDTGAFIRLLAAVLINYSAAIEYVRGASPFYP